MSHGEKKVYIYFFRVLCVVTLSNGLKSNPFLNWRQWLSSWFRLAFNSFIYLYLLILQPKWDPFLFFVLPLRIRAWRSIKALFQIVVFKASSLLHSFPSFSLLLYTCFHCKTGKKMLLGRNWKDDINLTLPFGVSTKWQTAGSS